jgi:PAS domain-containing protein
MTIFRKSLLTLGSAVFIMAAVLIIAVLVFMDSLYYELNAKALSNTTSTLFSVFPREDLRKFFENKNAGRSFPYKEDRYRLTLIEKNGEVLWDSQVERRMVNHIDREEVTAALEGREGQAMRDSLSAGTKQIYSALPVRAADGTVIGVFRLSVEVPSFWQRIAPEAFPFLLLAAVLVIAAFLGIYRFSYSLMASLDRLVDIARETGDFRLSDTGMGETEEILTLEKALRSMSTELKLALGEARMESRRLETILNSMSEAVIATDDKLMLLLINPCARKLFNPLYSAGDANHCSQPLRYTPPRPRTEDSQADVSPRKESLLETTHSTELEWTARKVLETRNPIETEITLCANGTDSHFNVSVTIYFFLFIFKQKIVDF